MIHTPREQPEFIFHPHHDCTFVEDVITLHEIKQYNQIYPIKSEVNQFFCKRVCISVINPFVGVQCCYLEHKF